MIEYAETAPPPGHKHRKQPAAARLGGQSVRRFEVDRNVHVEQGARTADGAHGVVDLVAQTIVLTGTPETPPVLRDKGETLSGERILFHLDNEDVEVWQPKLLLRRSVANEPNPDTPLRVEAARLVLHKEARLARFTDDVIVRRGDTTVRSPRMDAKYDGVGQVTRLELRGGVDLRQGERRATGESADYDAKTKDLVLTGDPKLYDRGDVLSGQRIDVALDSHEVRVDQARGKLRPEAHKDEEARP
jgi:lipopolysaccharide transport protein LptA